MVTRITILETVVVRSLLWSKSGPNFKTQVALERIIMWSWVPPGLETKNDFADEGQQKIIALLSCWRSR
jgi:hypothetical protein